MDNQPAHRLAPVDSPYGVRRLTTPQVTDAFRVDSYR